MHDLPTRVFRTVRNYRMIPAGGRVLVAVSGGSDSVALALLVHELEARGGWQLAGIAHLNHALREAADADEEFCRGLAASLRVPFVSERAAIRELAREQQRRLKMPRGRPATPSSNGLASRCRPTSSRPATRATIRRRPFCCG